MAMFEKNKGEHPGIKGINGQQQGGNHVNGQQDKQGDDSLGRSGQKIVFLVVSQTNYQQKSRRRSALYLAPGYQESLWFGQRSAIRNE